MFNHSSVIDFQDFINLCKKCTGKPYSFLVIDTTFASDNSLCFRKNLLERIQKLIITIDDKITDEKLQYNISRKIVKISAIILEVKYYLQAKLINMKILQVNKYCPHIENLVYRTTEYTYSFENYQTINTFGRDIYDCKITLKQTDKDQINLLVEIVNFQKKNKTAKSRGKAKEKRYSSKPIFTF